MFMDRKTFYNKVEKIVLFPGSLDELNQREECKRRRNLYEFFPNDTLLSGIVIPSERDINEFTNALLQVAGEEEQNFSDLMWNNFYFHDKLLNLDLRIKANKMGANGLIRYQYLNKSEINLNDSRMKSVSFDIYMGVPVKIVGTR